MKNYIYILFVLFGCNIINAQLGGGGSEPTTFTTICPTFFPEPSTTNEIKKLVVSGWVKEKHTTQQVSYSNSAIKVNFFALPNSLIPMTASDDNLFYPTGEIIEGWQRIVGVFEVPESYAKIELELIAGITNASIDSYFDDVRVMPFNGNIKTFVYDEQNQRLMAELDMNNFATFYEYGLEGELLRIKKETERGIYTIQETRSNTAKGIE